MADKVFKYKGEDGSMKRDELPNGAVCQVGMSRQAMCYGTYKVLTSGFYFRLLS